MTDKPKQISGNIVLLADSRGRGLEAGLNRSPDSMRFHVETYPGARLKDLINRAGHLSKAKKDGKPIYNLIIIFGGICSITKIAYMPYRAAVLRHDTVDELLANYKSECEDKEMSKCSIPLLLVPIVGIDLIQYAGCWNKALYEMQPIVDETVTLVNIHTRRVNEKNGLPTPNTSSCIHRCRGGNRGYRTHYQKLSDGCHPTEDIKKEWVKAIIECCRMIFS